MELTYYSSYHLKNTANDRASLHTASLEIVVLSIFQKYNSTCFLFVFFPRMISRDTEKQREGRENSHMEDVYAADSCQSRVRGIRVIFQRGVAMVKGTEEEED